MIFHGSHSLTVCKNSVGQPQLEPDLVLAVSFLTVEGHRRCQECSAH